MVDLGLLKSGKVELQSTIDQVKPEVNFLGYIAKRLTLIVEEPLLGRNAHSARYGESIHDRRGKPVSENLQEQASF